MIFSVSALLFAANNGHHDLVETLIDIGADIEDRSNNWKTPLLWASLWGHYRTVEVLINHGANMSVYDIEGMTAVMSATINRHDRVVQLLIDHGAEVLAKNRYNATALSIAQAKGFDEIVEILEPYFPKNNESPFALAFDLIVTFIIETLIIIAEWSFYLINTLILFISEWLDLLATKSLSELFFIARERFLASMTTFQAYLHRFILFKVREIMEFDPSGRISGLLLDYSHELVHRVSAVWHMKMSEVTERLLAYRKRAMDYAIERLLDYGKLAMGYVVKVYEHLLEWWGANSPIINNEL
jgi:hypothetical protein